MGDRQLSMNPHLPGPSDGIDVSVTLVSTDERKFLEPMLPQLYRSAKGVKMEVLLVDNACTDGTAELQGRFPDLKVIPNTRRLGFSANHNLAMRRSRGRYILCLNPDVLFDENAQTVAEMAAFMDAHPACGVSGCKALNAEKQLIFPARRFQTLRIVLARRAGGLFASKRVLDRYFYREHSMDDTFEADWLQGCFLFMRREALAEVGLFDELYFKYFEDVDLCRRMAARGWKVMYYGGARFYHLEQRSSTKLFSRYAWLHLKSWIRWRLRRRYYRRIEREHAGRGACRAE
jgi:N-acetylglucosaminyl-diphospho-decaprenol L-rhamnosyltransferase